MAKNRNAYFKEYYRKKQQEKGLKVKRYKSHKNETEEEKAERIKAYNRKASKKHYKNNAEKCKAKRRERYQKQKLAKSQNVETVEKSVDN